MGFITDLFGADEAKKAAKVQQEGYQQAGQTIQGGGDQALSRYTQYADTSQNANQMINQALAGDYSSFYESPDYQYRLQQGQDAIGAGAAARGMNLSGATLKDLGANSQGLASTEYGNWYNRLAGLRNEGIGIAGNQGAIDQNTARGVADTQLGAAGARASGYMADANIKNSLMTGLVDAATSYGTSWLPQPG